ncbi:phosphatase PAP2 family protein [Patescibacteria group bacterium]
MKYLLLSIFILILGVSWHMAALAIVDSATDHFPAIYDIVIERLPVIDLYGIGELAFFIYLAIFGFIFWRSRWPDLPSIIAMLGIFYGLRGFYLLLIPIGAPFDAPDIASRFVLYPYPTHAFFPGGHIGIMFIMAMMINNKTARYLLMTYVLLFGFGSMLTRAHYTVDIIGGLVLGYAVYAWGVKHLRDWIIKPKNT